MQGDNLHYLLAASLGHTAMFYMLVAAAVMIPTVWLPDLKALSYLGFAGVSATTAVVGTVRPFLSIPLSFYHTSRTAFQTWASLVSLLQLLWSELSVPSWQSPFCYAMHPLLHEAP